MAIKSVGTLNQTLNQAKTKDWSKSVEFGLQNFPEGTTENGVSQSFGQFLATSLGEVNKLQKNADTAIQKLASGETKNIHETLLAVEKAEIAFKTMNQIRQKVITAYNEVMKMQI